MVKFTSLKGLGLLAVVFVFISCGSQKPMVENVSVSTSEIDGDAIVNLKADLAMGNVLLPNASFPIILPKIGRQVGHVSLISAGVGRNQIEISLNVSDSVNLELAQVRLPNGSLMPLIADQKALSIPVGKVEVILSLVPGAQALGVVIPIKSFDSIGRKTGTAALVPLFHNNGVLGAAGVYTSKEAGKNGFVMITDISSYMGDFGIESAGVKMAQMQQAPLSYRSQQPSYRTERKINNGLYRLHRKRARLRL